MKSMSEIRTVKNPNYIYLQQAGGKPDGYLQVHPRKKRKSRQDHIQRMVSTSLDAGISGW